MEKKRRQKKEKKEGETTNTRNTKKSRTLRKKEAGQFISVGLFIHRLKHILILTSWEMHWCPAFSVSRMCAGCQRAGCRRDIQAPQMDGTQGLLDADPAAHAPASYARDTEALRRPRHMAPGCRPVISPSLASRPRGTETRRYCPSSGSQRSQQPPPHCFFSLSPQLHRHSSSTQTPSSSVLGCSPCTPASLWTGATLQERLVDGREGLA